MFMRETAFFFAPRLWAEEGTQYFAYAYRYAHSELWYRGILNVQRGYFSLWPNLATTLAANFIPLEQAPLVTTLLALVIQVIPVGLVLWSKVEIWQSFPRKIAGIAVFLFIPLSGEIWLNTINSQFYFALIAVLVLIEPGNVTGLRKWSYRILLLLAGLTGPVTCILSPLFIFVAVWEKKRERAVQAAILSLCAIIQLALLGMFGQSDKIVTLRFADLNGVSLIYAVWTQSIGLVMGGLDLMREWAQRVELIRSQSDVMYLFLALGLLVVESAFLWLASTGLAVREKLILLGSYLLLIFFSFAGALSQDKSALIVPGVGGRYFWVPNILLCCLLIANVFSAQHHKYRRGVFAVILLSALILGGLKYHDTLLIGQDWSNWKDEIKLWQADPAYKVKIWPPPWEMSLTK